MPYIIMGTGSSGGVSYSQDEQDTGLTWIDGKPIYQRTFMFGKTISAAGSSWTQSNIVATSLGISKIINAVGYGDTGWSYPFTVAADQTYLVFMHFRNATVGFIGLTIQYIKQ